MACTSAPSFDIFKSQRQPLHSLDPRMEFWLKCSNVQQLTLDHSKHCFRDSFAGTAFPAFKNNSMQDLQTDCLHHRAAKTTAPLQTSPRYHQCCLKQEIPTADSQVWFSIPSYFMWVCGTPVYALFSLSTEPASSRYLFSF